MLQQGDLHIWLLHDLNIVAYCRCDCWQRFNVTARCPTPLWSECCIFQMRLLTGIGRYSKMTYIFVTWMLHISDASVDGDWTLQRDDLHLCDLNVAYFRCVCWRGLDVTARWPTSLWPECCIFQMRLLTGIGRYSEMTYIFVTWMLHISDASVDGDWTLQRDDLHLWLPSAAPSVWNAAPQRHWQGLPWLVILSNKYPFWEHLTFMKPPLTWECLNPPTPPPLWTLNFKIDEQQQ